jgi:hypothetical protein
MSIQGSDSGPSYDRHITALQEQTQLKDEQLSLGNNIRLQEQLLTYFLTSSGVQSTSNPLLLEIVGEIQKEKGRLKEIVRFSLPTSCTINSPTHLILLAN